MLFSDLTSLPHYSNKYSSKDLGKGHSPNCSDLGDYIFYPT